MKKTRSGRGFEFGDVVIAEVFFMDLVHKKKRPALVLFEEHSNVVVAGITSNLNMDGILLKKRKGLPVDSVIKLNYIFTLDKDTIVKRICRLTEEEKEEVCTALLSSIGCYK